jgi:hypothetical protein
VFNGRDDTKQQFEAATIVLEAGGDHQFDLGHLRRQGAIRLIRLLLHTAGYRQPITWHVRVEKKIACGPETRCVTVVGSKPWCCYLKVKPGDNNTGHFCSLLMPDGFRGESVYDALKGAEDDVTRAWREGVEEVTLVDSNGTPADSAAERQHAARAAAHSLLGPPDASGGAPAPAAPAPVSLPPADEDPGEDEEGVGESGTSELLGWTRDEDKVRLTLLAIHELVQEGKATGLASFVAALANKLNWQGLRRKQIGAIFATLKRRGHAYKIQQGSVPLGYALTEQGRAHIQDLLPPGGAAAPPVSAAPAPAAPPTDPLRLAAALSGVTQRYATAHQKLQENRDRRAQLLAEVARLDAEARELSRFVENAEVQSLLQRLLQLTPAENPPPPAGP